MDKTLDLKLARIRTGQYTPSDFIIADAKDADMGFGATGPGPVTTSNESINSVSEQRYKAKADYLDAMKSMVESGLIDIMLMSASSAEVLSDQGLFSNNATTAAIRLNDTTDIWVARGSTYRESPSHPFRTALLSEVTKTADLGLYSITYSNDLQKDLKSLKAYRMFRQELVETNMRHFLEVFNPAFNIGIGADNLGFYINDMIVKTLAGVTRKEAPHFLKIQFNGFNAMQELANYDTENLIVGILGGAKGTTRDTFELVHQAEQAGARVALFGRKINLSESPELLVGIMRRVIAGELNPAEAVTAYHAGLQEADITPQRSMHEDAQITDETLKT